MSPVRTSLLTLHKLKGQAHVCDMHHAWVDAGIVIKYAQYFTALVAVRYTLYTSHRAEPEGRAIPLPTPVPLTPATPRRATNPDPAAHLLPWLSIPLRPSRAGLALSAGARLARTLAKI
jgi:hypothetical protein